MLPQPPQAKLRSLPSFSCTTSVCIKRHFSWCCNWAVTCSCEQLDIKKPKIMTTLTTYALSHTDDFTNKFMYVLILFIYLLYCVAQANFKLKILLLHFLSIRITDVCHHTWLTYFLKPLIYRFQQFMPFFQRLLFSFYCLQQHIKMTDAMFTF